jgi:hypothetical protein
MGMETSSLLRGEKIYTESHTHTHKKKTKEALATEGMRGAHFPMKWGRASI